MREGNNLSMVGFRFPDSIENFERQKVSEMFDCEVVPSTVHVII